MVLSKKTSKSLKQCEFTGCTNTFIGFATKKYCDDIRCIELRTEFNKNKQKENKTVNNDNLVINKLYKKKLKNGQTLLVRCRAHSTEGRCNNKYSIVIDSSQYVYPKYCVEHRNEFKRKMFEKGL